jgi:hypothetical protein
MHYAVREEYAGLAFDLSDTIWQSNTRLAYWHGIDALVPDTPVLLQHVCAHATSDWLIRRGRLYQIGDLQLIAGRMTPDDWDVFGEAIGPDNSRYVYPALAFVQKYTNLPVPVGLLERIRALTPPRLCAHVDTTELADASQSNSETRSGIGVGIAHMLARSRRERVLMWLRSLFPRRWNLAHRYPRLVAAPFWPLCYVIINADRLWHLIHAKVVGE